LKITQISEALKAGMQDGIDELAREMGLIRRQSKITGQSLVQGLVFGFLENPQASEVQVAQSVGRAGIPVTSQAVNARLTEETAKFFHSVLERMTQIVVEPNVKTQTLLDRFSEVNVHDSTTINLPNSLSELWPGCGNRTEHGQAALKLQTQWNLRSGALKMLTLHAGREQDRSAPVQKADITPKSLRLADLGYFDLSVFARIGQSQAYWLTRYLSGVKIFMPDGTPVYLPEWLECHCTDGVEVDISVRVGNKDRLPARLIAVRVSQQVADERRRKLRDKARGRGQTVSQLSLALANWSIFLTNIPQSLLTLDEILIIARARARWQIELLFKLWKSSGRIDESRSRKPYRILCELYAKMIGQIIQHWLIIYTCWSLPDRSMLKAAAAIKSCATSLLVALRDSSSKAIASAIDLIARSVASTCHISKRSKKSALFQLLAIDHA
jgi:hypothetical protein